MFGAPKVLAPAWVDKGPYWLGPEGQALIMYWRMQDLWGPVNLVAQMVAESNDTLQYLQDVNWDSVRATHG
jgi:hypothetical protein